MSTTKKQQEKTDWLAIGFFAVVFIVIIAVAILGAAWVYGWQEKWRDTGVVLSKNKFLDNSPGSKCCNFIFNYTILTDHHGEIRWFSNSSCLGSYEQQNSLNISQTVAIKACNNGYYEVHGDP